MIQVAATSVRRKRRVLGSKSSQALHVQGSKSFSATMKIRTILEELGIEHQNEHFKLHYFRLTEELVPPGKLVDISLLKETFDEEVLKEYGEPNLERVRTALIFLWHFLQKLQEERKQGKVGRYVAYVEDYFGKICSVTATLRPEGQKSVIASEPLSLYGSRAKIRKATTFVVPAY